MVVTIRADPRADKEEVIISSFTLVQQGTFLYDTMGDLLSHNSLLYLSIGILFKTRKCGCARFF